MNLSRRSHLIVKILIKRQKCFHFQLFIIFTFHAFLQMAELRRQLLPFIHKKSTKRKTKNSAQIGNPKLEKSRMRSSRRALSCCYALSFSFILNFPKMTICACVWQFSKTENKKKTKEGQQTLF